MEEAAQELLNHFNYRNMDALLKVTRNILEAMRKRISSSTVSYTLVEKEDKNHSPFFKCFAVLAIPIIVMQPALDEVQQAVNKAAQMIINVSKGVSQWNKDRKKAMGRCMCVCVG